MYHWLQIMPIYQFATLIQPQLIKRHCISLSVLTIRQQIVPLITSLSSTNTKVVARRGNKNINYNVFIFRSNHPFLCNWIISILIESRMIFHCYENKTKSHGRSLASVSILTYYTRWPIKGATLTINNFKNEIAVCIITYTILFPASWHQNR